MNVYMYIYIEREIHRAILVVIFFSLKKKKKRKKEKKKGVVEQLKNKYTSRFYKNTAEISIEKAQRHLMAFSIELRQEPHHGR